MTDPKTDIFAWVFKIQDGSLKWQPFSSVLGILHVGLSNVRWISILTKNCQWIVTFPTTFIGPYLKFLFSPLPFLGKWIAH